MGNIINKCKKKKEYFNSTLLEPLNTDQENTIIFNDIITIKNQIKILESTTQSSIKNIATDMNHFNETHESLKKRIETLEQLIININSNNENDNSIYHEPY